MTGPEHYTEAERALRSAEAAREQMLADQAVLHTQAARVHAVLAPAAATAEASPRLVHNTNGHPSEWWTALHGEERS